MPKLIKPDYSQNFAQLPVSIAHFFGAKAKSELQALPIITKYTQEYDAVCLLLLDAFGWRFLKQFTEVEPMADLVELVKSSEILKLSAQFPSTTAVHVTTITTGLPIAESGVCEWHYYESRVDRVITPLLFTIPENRTPDYLRSLNISPEEIFSPGWFYSSLSDVGVQTVGFLKRQYAKSSYNRVVSRDSTVCVYDTEADGLAKLAQCLVAAKSPIYTNYYFSEFDALLHEFGPDSPKPRMVLEKFIQEFNSSVVSPLANAGKKVLFLLTADHGMTTINPAKTHYLELEIPEAINWLKTTKQGQAILPVGSSRDLFLHVKPEYLAEAYGRLQSHYREIAEVFLLEDLIKNGYFGNNVTSDIFLANIGDILVAPFAGESVYWFGNNGIFAEKFFGHHGGLTADEMESMLLVYPT